MVKLVYESRFVRIIAPDCATKEDIIEEFKDIFWFYAERGRIFKNALNAIEELAKEDENVKKALDLWLRENMQGMIRFYTAAMFDVMDGLIQYAKKEGSDSLLDEMLKTAIGANFLKAFIDELKKESEGQED